MILGFSWVIFRFHVNFLGCMYSVFSYIFGLNFKLGTSKGALDHLGCRLLLEKSG